MKSVKGFTANVFLIITFLSIVIGSYYIVVDVETVVKLIRLYVYALLFLYGPVMLVDAFSPEFGQTALSKLGKFVTKTRLVVLTSLLTTGYAWSGYLLGSYMHQARYADIPFMNSFGMALLIGHATVFLFGDRIAYPIAKWIKSKLPSDSILNFE